LSFFDVGVGGVLLSLGDFRAPAFSLRIGRCDGAFEEEFELFMHAGDQVTWIHPYVSADKKKTFCIYDGPSPEAIRRAAGRSKLPISCITEVQVLDRCFYN
jgi:hypothetical protein